MRYKCVVDYLKEVGVVYSFYFLFKVYNNKVFILGWNFLCIEGVGGINGWYVLEVNVGVWKLWCDVVEIVV